MWFRDYSTPIFMNYLYTIFIAYLIGSIPSGLILSKAIWKKDLRKYGSHNIGATNAWRVLGKEAGIIIFALDFLKGLLGVFVGIWFSTGAVHNPNLLMLGGIMAIVGHSYPIFLFFRGGKSVATSIGVLTMLMPKVAVLTVIIWFLIVLFSRYVSLASITAAITVPFQACFWNAPWQYIILTVLAAILVAYRHKDNINRLLMGTEPRIY